MQLTAGFRMSEFTDMQVYRTNLSIRFQTCHLGLGTYPETQRTKMNIAPGISAGAMRNTNTTSAAIVLA